MNKLCTFLLLCVFTACSPAVERIPGVPGPQGPQGETGANGHSLVSETVSASENECDEQGGQRLDILLDNDDSLTVSEGDIFQSSLIACNGKNGLNGATGLQGAPGAQGIPGAAGPVGTTGQTGATGVAGPAGSVGPQGATGVAGPVGPTGPQGPQGATGAVGPAGSGATLQAFTLGSSCTSLGSGLYAKKDGDTAKVFSSSSCSSNSSVATVKSAHTSNGEASMWLTATRLAFADSDTNSGVILRVLNFN